MSYRVDLDEHDEAALVMELERRTDARANGRCDYCNREPSTTPCKFPERHREVPPPSIYRSERLASDRRPRGAGKRHLYQARDIGRNVTIDIDDSLFDGLVEVVVIEGAMEGDPGRRYTVEGSIVDIAMLLLAADRFRKAVR